MPKLILMQCLSFSFFHFDNNKTLEATRSCGLSMGKKMVASNVDWKMWVFKNHTHVQYIQHTHPSPSLEVISSTCWQDYADGGEMIIRAGDRLSQYKCN